MRNGYKRLATVAAVNITSARNKHTLRLLLRRCLARRTIAVKQVHAYTRLCRVLYVALTSATTWLFYRLTASNFCKRIVGNWITCYINIHCNSTDACQSLFADNRNLLIMENIGKRGVRLTPRRTIISRRRHAFYTGYSIVNLFFHHFLLILFISIVFTRHKYDKSIRIIFVKFTQKC